MKNKTGMIAFFVLIAIIAISILVAAAYDNYLMGIIMFLVLAFIGVMVYMQFHAEHTKPTALKLLKQENPEKAALDKCIDDLGGSAIGDEESKELIRRLMAKRDELEIK